MKNLRALVAIAGMAAFLAMGSIADVAHAADKSSATSPAQAKKPVSYPATLILCRPHQTCPP